jgi:hypothetical protein
MMASEVTKIMQTNGGNNIHHVSIVYYRVNSNAIYKLTTELNAFM